MKFNFKIAGIKVENIEIGAVEVSTDLSLTEAKGLNDMAKELIDELPSITDKLIEAYKKASQPIIIMHNNTTEEPAVDKEAIETKIAALELNLKSIIAEEDRVRKEWLNTFDEEKSEALSKELAKVREEECDLNSLIFRLEMELNK